ncbi:LysR family transcriptional regulator [Citricoccus sp. SGAir0253]|uniref:LysR substrate-binding domain-containing protein n=1 Tax=Citricoccus sp. SGAir0253 TaxID=2567881 RepID=UPI0010CCB705|nr:LysR substrate-binding domain-containing protein [Citricoccus sp. SGAir0253]QCU79017.1 LysR family transcriptional regulator [Citricoccus sp. SGAir0253]
MDLRQMRYFVAVAEERHFGRAAERLHMAQPPLSQQIKQLEAGLGTQLLERTTRKVDLTEAGRLMLERARQILADVESLEKDVREVGAGAAGVLRVGFVGSATYRVMPAVVQLARRELPGVRLHVMGEMLTPNIEQGLLENRLDVAVLRPPVQSPEVTLDALEGDSLLVALPAGHRLAAGEGPVDLAELAGEDFVSYPQASAVATISREACRRAGFSPRVVQEATETSTLLAFVGAGMGLALVPDGARRAAAWPVAYRELAESPEVGLALAWKRGSRSLLLPGFRSLAHRAVEQVRRRPSPADTAPPIAQEAP